MKYNEVNKKSIALISMKITNFSFINDNIGYQIGNSLIIEIVKRIETKIDSSINVLARTSRDEFMILLRESCDIDKIFILGQTLLSSLESPFLVEKEEIFISTAMGIGLYSEEIKSVEQLIENANIAREYVMQKGENNFQFYKIDIKQKYMERLRLEKFLRKALENNEFTLNYQPQIDLKTGKVIGMEALIRWENPELGSVSPNKFIPLAEETGLIIPIGTWVLEEACRQNKIWHEMGMTNLCVAVNISPIQFHKTNIIETIHKMLEKYKLSGKQLEIEITEGLLVENIGHIDQQLNKIKEMGVKIAIDDFGTGYSSLSYLKELQVNKVKIDRVFIKDYPEKDEGTIAKIIVNLAHHLKLEVIAEGVETEKQLTLMKEIQCDQIQGYYYSPPLKADEFQKLLKREYKD